MSIDLEASKLKSSTSGIVKTAPLLKTIRTSRPDNINFFRIRDGEDWTMDFSIFSSKGKDKEKYLVIPEYQQELAERNSLIPLRFYFGIITVI